MGRKELRDWLAKEMKLDTVPEPLWQWAVKQEWVKDVIDESMTLHDFLDLVRELMGFHTEMQYDWHPEYASERQGKGTRASIETLTHELNENEVQRAKAIQEYTAKIAAAHWSVHDFRSRFLAGGVISPEQARAVLTSRAAATLPYDGFTSHEAMQIAVDPQVEYFVRIRRQRGVVGESLDARETGKGYPYRDYVPVTVLDQGPAAEPREIGAEVVLVFRKDGNLEVNVVEEGSLLDELSTTSHWLCASYPWQVDQALWFVLTGEPPKMAAVTRTHPQNHNPITPYDRAIQLTIKPWVRAETVYKIYRGLQQQELGKRARSISECKLAVFRFVVGQQEVQLPDEEGNDLGEQVEVERLKLKRPPWRPLLETWNQRYPKGHEWHYKDVWNFSRDYRRAEDVLVGPVRRAN